VTWGPPNQMLVRHDDSSVLHVNLTDESRGLIGAEQIRRMKRGALLINTARGPVVESEALVEALNAGHQGAGIDDFDNEPIPAGHPLLACHQVVLMPHNADQTPEGMELPNAGVVENVIAFLQGRPRNRVV